MGNGSGGNDFMAEVGRVIDDKPSAVLALSEKAFLEVEDLLGKEIDQAEAIGETSFSSQLSRIRWAILINEDLFQLLASAHQHPKAIQVREAIQGELNKRLAKSMSTLLETCVQGGGLIPDNDFGKKESWNRLRWIGRACETGAQGPVKPLEILTRLRRLWETMHTQGEEKGLCFTPEVELGEITKYTWYPRSGERVDGPRSTATLRIEMDQPTALRLMSMAKERPEASPMAEGERHESEIVVASKGFWRKLQGALFHWGR